MGETGTSQACPPFDIHQPTAVHHLGRSPTSPSPDTQPSRPCDFVASFDLRLRSGLYSLPTGRPVGRYFLFCEATGHEHPQRDRRPGRRCRTHAPRPPATSRASSCPTPSSSAPPTPTTAITLQSLPLRLARAARMSPMQIADVIAKQMRSPAYVGEVSGRCRRASSTSASPTAGWPSRSTRSSQPAPTFAAQRPRRGAEGAGRVRQRQPHGPAARRQRALGVDRRLAGARAGSRRLRGREGIPGQRRS